MTAPEGERWECGPHANAWGGHDARCRRVRRAPTPEPVDVGTRQALEPGEAYYVEHGWSGCAGSAWSTLPPATKDGWRHAAAAEKRGAERAEAEVASLRERLAKVEALRDEWISAGARPMPQKAEGETERDQGVRIGVWYSVRKAADDLRATLAEGGA